MRGNPALHRPEAATQNFAKISVAFLIGLVTVFGSALVYSNLEQRRELVPAAPSAQPKQAAYSVEPLTPAVIPARSSPENLIPGEDQRQNTTPVMTAVSPESSTRNGGVPLRSAVRARASVGKPMPASTVGVPSAVSQSSNDNLPLPFGPNSNAAPQLPTSAFTYAEPPRTRPEPVSAAPASSVIMVPATTTLTVQLSDTLSSDHNRPGDTFRATLAAPLVVNGYLLAETGAAVQGRVEAARRAPLLGGRSELRVVLTEISMWNGQRTRLQTGYREVKGARSMLTNTAKMATVGSGFMAGMRAAALPAGAQLTFILTAPLTATGTQLR